ncbi:acyltransferase ChoActase/COT/CPT [Pilobolus umbonatus]|nr:acyltransferase ChoActase/COT/CPT [Pilobolus umbonatus]
MSPPTFSLQSTLPRLPVPSLEESCTLYLKSLVPLQTKEEHEKTKKIVSDFLASDLSRSLQERLIDIDHASPTNWLEDNFWLKKAYLEWREPLMVNSNWYILGQQDAHHPTSLLNGVKDGVFSHFQVHRAAHMLHRALQFKEMIDKEKLPIDMMKGGKAQCMWQYSRIFGVTRVPLYDCDTLVQSNSHHISVIVRDQIYIVNVYKEVSKDTWVPMTTNEIEKSLLGILGHVNQLDSLSVPIPLLTSWDRDNWTTARNHLLTIDPTHRENLQLIESSILTLALDDHSNGTDRVLWTKTMFCGNQALGQGHNRWYDKSITFVVENDGNCGFSGEHSPIDALTVSYIFDYMLIEPCPGPCVDTLVTPVKNDTPLKYLKFTSDPKLDDCLRRAQVSADATAEKSDSDVLCFEDYGTDWIKKVSRLPPDAFCQMVLQLAYYRLHHQVTPTYETASTRKYLHGRTETIRSCSVDSKAFVEGFDHKDLSIKDKYQLLAKATQSHRTYTQIASDGHGCDRHLMVLRILNGSHEMIDAQGERVKAEMAPIFTDPIHFQSQTWKLSTSGLHAGVRLMGTGFGAVYEDGYGVNYMAAPTLIKFGMECKRVPETVSVSTFKETVRQCLLDMRQVCEEVNSSKL